MTVASALEALHFYRRVPSDLSKGTPTGGLLSLFAACTMAYLFFSDLALFWEVKYEHEVRVDQIYDDAIRVNFNLTMHRMPCEHVSVDVTDVLGASVLNLSTGIHRERVLASGERAKFSLQKRLKSWQSRLAGRLRKVDNGPADTVPAIEGALDSHLLRLTTGNFSAFLQAHPRVLVLFGTDWCRWTQDMLPDWAAATAEVRRLGLDEKVSLAYIDCSRGDSAMACARHFVAVFPSVHLYEKGSPALHQNYIGPRNAGALVSFAKLATAAAGTRPLTRGLTTPFHGDRKHGDSGREGCALVGSVFVSRVPGSLRVRAHSEGHSFNPRWIDMDHTIHTFSYGVPDERERLHHAREIAAITEAQLKLAARRDRQGEGDGVIPTGEGHYVHIEHLALLPQHSRGSDVKPFRAGKRNNHMNRLISNVERLRIKQAHIHHIHRHDTHGPNSLANQSFISELPFVSIEHFIKVVPTTYRFHDGDEVDSFTYTVNNRESVKGYTPVIIFSYDFSPLRVLISEKRAELATFLTQVCAIIGGVFTVVGLVDSVLFHAGDLIARKMQLGKAI